MFLHTTHEGPAVVGYVTQNGDYDLVYLSQLWIRQARAQQLEQHDASMTMYNFAHDDRCSLCETRPTGSSVPMFHLLSQTTTRERGNRTKPGRPRKTNIVTPLVNEARPNETFRTSVYIVCF